MLCQAQMYLQSESFGEACLPHMACGENRMNPDNRGAFGLHRELLEDILPQDTNPACVSTALASWHT